MNLHHPSSPNVNGFDLDGGGGSGECGVINPRVLQQTVAAKWAADVINNRSLSQELTIGTRIKFKNNISNN